jgi:hypothetical protein
MTRIHSRLLAEISAVGGGGPARAWLNPLEGDVSGLPQGCRSLS